MSLAAFPRGTRDQRPNVASGQPIRRRRRRNFGLIDLSPAVEPYGTWGQVGNNGASPFRGTGDIRYGLFSTVCPLRAFSTVSAIALDLAMGHFQPPVREYLIQFDLV